MTDNIQSTEDPQRPAESDALVGASGDDGPAGAGSDGDEITTMVEQPAKVMRIGTMIKQLLEEVRAAPLDEAGRQRLREIHDLSIRELEEGLAPDLRDELERFTLPFGENVRVRHEGPG